MTPRKFTDPRGTFLESFSEPAFVEAVGHPLDLRQANTSVSAAGVLRGIHFADVPPSQAKYVMRSEEHTSELQSRGHLVCRLLLEKKKSPSQRQVLTYT